VLVDTLGLRADLPSVESDSRGGALTAVQHLLDLGHRRIACIEGPDRYPCCVERTDAYREALAAAGIPVDPDLIRPAGFHTGAAFKHAVELFGLDDRPTAVFTHNDQMAYAVLDAAAECGLRVPDDVSVVGFDDAIPSSHMRPPLTTIRNPFEEMGRRAAELLLDGLSDRSKPAVTHIRMPTDIVVRASTGPVPRVADGGPRKRIPRGRTPRGPKMIDAVYEAVPQDPSDP
jgi:LacI family transcriptional regulator